MSKTIAYYEKPPYNAMLFVFTKNGVKKYQIGNFCSIGRFTKNGTTPDIPIASHIVSRKHGEISVVKGKYYYRDCDSTNGTYINNRLIGKNSSDGKSASEINNGDILGFDLIQNGKHHSERVIAIFTTTVSEDIKWSKVSLNNQIVGIDIGRSVEHGLKIDNQMFSERHASFFLLRMAGLLLIITAKTVCC